MEDNNSKGSWLYVIGSVLGGLIIAFAILALFNAAVTPLATANPQHVITTSGGMQVKMGKVTAELAQTQIDVGSGGKVVIGLTDAPKWIDNVFLEAGGSTTTLLTGNLTVCLKSVVSYKTELSGFVTATLGSECRNFEPGMMVGNIVTFADDYTTRINKLYKEQYTFIHKE